MEPMDTLKKPAMMARLRNSKGFSLVEMAIVLVIIGIIIAAIVKGQDLIVNARAKTVVSAMNSWRNLSMAFLDRNGRLPGDGGKTGYLIPFGSYSSPNVEINHTMTTAPANPVLAGGSSFYVYFGNTGIAGTPGKNIIAVCNTADCSTAFTADELEIMKAVDTSMDGVADSGAGQVRGTDTITTDPTVSTQNGLITADAKYPGVTGTPGKTWGTSETFKALIWAFDKPF